MWRLHLDVVIPQYATQDPSFVDIIKTKLECIRKSMRLELLECIYLFCSTATVGAFQKSFFQINQEKHRFLKI